MTEGSYIYKVFVIYQVSFSNIFNRRHCISKNGMIKKFQSITIENKIKINSYSIFFFTFFRISFQEPEKNLGNWTGISEKEMIQMKV